MALTHSEMDSKLHEHFAFEANDDVDGVLATLSPDVEHDVVGWPTGPTHGRAGARPFYENLFSDLAEGRVEHVRRHRKRPTPEPEGPHAVRRRGSGIAKVQRPADYRLLTSATTRRQRSASVFT